MNPLIGAMIASAVIVAGLKTTPALMERYDGMMPAFADLILAIFVTGVALKTPGLAPAA